LHAYELIVVGATATTDATLICKIDGVVRALPANKSSWAAGTILPVQQNIGAVQPGWLPCAVNISNVVNSLYTHQIRVIAGPTVDSLF
jgi:hypothetical protein